jgi:hypothetical protein
MGIEGAYHQRLDAVTPGTERVLSAAQQSEALRRLDAIHQLVVAAYPRPLGQEADWRRVLNQFEFAPGITTASLFYESWYSYYVCQRPGTGDVGYFGDNGTYARVYVNDPGRLQSNMSPLEAEIDGRRVLMFKPVIGSWKGNDLHAENAALQGRQVLITRKGESPYLPVTRRQWLQYQQARIRPHYDKLIEDMKQFFIQPQTDAIDRLTKEKDATVRHFEAAFAESQANNLLDAPAVILGDVMSSSTPVFAPEGASAQLLVTANPAYIRKELPRYVPQFIVVMWSWDSGETSKIGGIQGDRFRRIFEADFPVEKLQALIDR